MRYRRRICFLGTSLLFCLALGIGGKRSTTPPEGVPLVSGVESKPLAERSDGGQSSDDGKLFERVSAEQTGIDFVIKWDKPAKFDRIFYSQNTGGGVTLGDYDGDELCDIYLTRPSGGNRLYRNLGDFRFEDVTEQVGLRDDSFWGTGASFVDIDNDGDLDLYACGYDCPNRLYVNQGDGQFIEMASDFDLDYHGASVMMAFADFDCDGDLDGYLVTAGLAPKPNQKFRVRFVNGRPQVIDELAELWKLLYMPGDRAKQIESGQYDHFYRNDGPDSKGQIRFVEASKQVGIVGTDIGQAATWWDYDEDGYPDLYVSNDYWGPDRLYHNNQNGTFTDMAGVALPHTPWSSMGADVADIDGDGRLDFMATDMAGSNHLKQKTGMGDMAKSGWFLEYGQPRQYPRNAVFLNTGTERFMEAAHLTGFASSDWTWTPRFDDLDNDGLIDLFITNGMTRNFTDSDLNEVASKSTKEGSAEFFRFWREQDFRKDQNVAYRNRGDLHFEDVSDAWGLDRLGVSFGAGTADLDGDGDLDIVVNNMDTAASIYRNRSKTGNCLRIRLRGTLSNRQGLGALVRIQTASGPQVRHVSLSRGWTSTSEPVVHFGVGELSRVELVTINWPSGHTQRLEDMAVNQIHVVTEPNGQPPKKAEPKLATPLFAPSSQFSDLNVVHEETPYDDFRRQPLLPNKQSQLGPGIACGDVNEDGRDDLFISGARGQSGKLLVSHGNDGFHENIPEAFENDRTCEDMGALFFDADGDRDLDLFVVSGGVECEPGSSVLADRLYLNDGKGGFTTAPYGAIPDLLFSGGVVAAADYDRDGDLDLFIGGRVIPGKYPLSPRSVLYRNDDGTFVDVTKEVAAELHASGMVTSAIWSDVNDDGWIDLMVTHEWGPVKLLLNRKGVLVDQTSQAGLSQLLGWWNGIAAADVDNDGDMDFAVTNFGLNTKYHASQSHPVQLFYGDFDQSGGMRLVESKFEGEKLFPVRGKSCSTIAMPFLSNKFSTYQSFALAELGDIYTPERLEKSHHFTANTLESGTLINDGQGHFEFRPWPRLAQIAPGFGVVFTDADGDHKSDIYFVQNFYGPQRETGRMDGGVSQLLLGQGDGTFRIAPPISSGLVVPGDSKSLTMTDLNGDRIPDFIVGVNDGRVLAFEHQKVTPGRTVVVRLLGKDGNPQAIGSRITVHLDGGSDLTFEVHAGGGYLSQSSSDWSFFVGDESGSSATVKSIDVRWPDTDRQATTCPIPERTR